MEQPDDWIDEEELDPTLEEALEEITADIGDEPAVDEELPAPVELVDEPEDGWPAD